MATTTKPWTGLSATDRSRLVGVHPDLVRVVERVAEDNPGFPFKVIDGVRSIKKQKEYVKAGSSWTLNSRHLTGHAIDAAPLLSDRSIPWKNWEAFRQMAVLFKIAAAIEKVPVEWAGDWVNRTEGPHFQLPRSRYPA